MQVPRRIAQGALLGVASAALAALTAEVVRPRGGRARLLDWDEITRLARRRLAAGGLAAAELRQVATGYRRLAAELERPLLEAVGEPGPGIRLPEFEALDRPGWLDLNVGIMRRVLVPLEEASRLPNSLLTDLGRAGVDRYVAALLAFLAGRVLGQFDPQLLGREPVQPALYLVEPNVAAWQAREDLPGDDLRRWLILHEMTHAWQFAAHPWLLDHLNGELEQLIALATGSGRSGLDHVWTLVAGVPGQLDALRRMQATMSLVEGYSNLVMNQVGKRILPEFGSLEEAYRRRSAERSAIELLVWRLTGLELKLQQYRIGEAFAQAIHDRHGMAVLNRAWEGPGTLPRPDELRHPERWYQRVVGGPAAGRSPARSGSADLTRDPCRSGGAPN